MKSSDESTLILTPDRARNYVALVYCVQGVSHPDSKIRNRPKSDTLSRSDMLKHLYDQDFCCLDCGVEFECSGVMKYNGATTEHVIPYRYGSTTNTDNIVVLCSECNTKRDKNFSMSIIEDHFGKISEEDIESMKKVVLS